jgi:hypothetical protein
VPNNVLSYATPEELYTLRLCDPAKVSKNADKISESIASIHAILPAELKNDAVVRTILNHSSAIASNSAQLANKLVGGDGGVVDAAPIPRSSSSLSHLDIERFAHTVSNQVLRRTPTTPNENDPDNTDPFWTKLRAYYVAYYDGKFYTYFGDHFDKPTASLTITDAEIVQSAMVFVELLMDEIFESPVWKGTDGKFYPGGNTNQPTSMTIKGARPLPINLGTWGCGMNVPKANAVRYLATSFSKAASTETSLTIKSAGSIEIGLGIVGKLNIGDNTTLTQLVQGVVSEIVGRLSVQLATPILETLDFEEQSIVAAAGGNKPPSKAMKEAAVNRSMTALFITRKPTGM